MITKNMKLEVLALAGSFAFSVNVPAADVRPTTEPKSFINYFLPSPIVGSLTTNIWGVATVWPRDPKNGLEDATMKQWNYWDGQIIKAPDGKYHLFCSRWDQAHGHRSKVIVIPFDGAALDRDLQSPSNSPKQ